MSNCLLEALKVKFLHPTWKIYYVKPHCKEGLPHFVWWNPTIKSYQHYTFYGRKPNWWRLLLFKGHVDGFPFEKLKIKLVRIL